MNQYEGFTPIFCCVITGLCEWTSNMPLEQAAEIWEKKYVKSRKQKLTIEQQSYFDFYPEAIKEYHALVEFYNALSEEKKNQIYNDYAKSTLFASIKYSDAD